MCSLLGVWSTGPQTSTTSAPDQRDENAELAQQLIAFRATVPVPLTEADIERMRQQSFELTRRRVARQNEYRRDPAGYLQRMAQRLNQNQ
jgi:hypothetical protein